MVALYHFDITALCVPDCCSLATVLDCLQADWVIEWLRTTGTAGEAGVTAETVVPTGATACPDEVPGSKNDAGASEAAAGTAS